MELLLTLVLSLQADESVDDAVKAVKALVEAKETETAAKRLVAAAVKFRGQKKIVDLAVGCLSTKGVATAAIEALGLVAHKEAVDRLLKELANASLKEDAARALKRATGQEFEKAAEWDAWWKKSRASFVFRKDRRSGTDVEAARKKLGGAGAAMKELVSDHYLALTDAPEERVRTFLQSFEELHAVMLKDHGFAELDRLLIVYCFKDEAGIRAFSEKERGGSGGGMMGGFASKDGWLAFYDGAKLNLDHIVFHEGTHQVLFNCLGISDPNWFHEGMAECVAARRRKIETQVARAVKTEIAEGRTLPLAQLLKEGVRGRQVAYLQSGSVVRFLREKHGEKKFAAWLKLLADGKTATEEALKAFDYAGVEELEKAWKEHWR